MLILANMLEYRGMEILYEDNHLIAVSKPHGMLTQGDDTGDTCLLEEVRKLIKDRGVKPGNVFLGLLHRLDRPVGGVVLFAKTSKGASRLSDQIRMRRVEKIYWAVCEGSPASAMGEVVQWLVKDEATNTVTAYGEEVPGSVKAELGYRVRQTIGEGKNKLSLMEIRPKTGRPHQIRVAMGTLGIPIVGDKKYGAQQMLDGNIALFARSFGFDQPVTKKRVMVTAEPTLPIFKQFV